MLHLDAVHASARAPDVFALKPPPQDATLLSSSHCLDKCCSYGPLRQPVLCSKSMLSVLPSSNDLDRVNAIASDQRNVCRLPKPKENSELRPLPRLRVAWNPSGPPRPPKPLAPSSSSTESGSVVVVHEPAEPGLSPENHRPCRENGVRSMNGPERPSMTGSSNNSGSGDGRSWLADVAASANISNSHGVAPPANPRLHESQSLLTPPAGSLFPPPVSIGGTEFTSSASPRLYSQYPLHTSYFSGHSQSASTPTHLSTLTPYSYYPFQFPPGYSSGHVLPRPVPQIEPYSTVLASMGSHPRSAFLPSQFSSLSPSTSSPGPVFQTGPRPLTPGFNQTVHLQPPQQYPSPSSVDLSAAEARSPKESERSLQQRHRVMSGSPSRCDNSNRVQNPGCSNAKSAAKNPSSPTSTSTSLLTKSINPAILPQELCAKMDSNREQSYRVPSGKEGSMKHRILTRPPDIRIDPLSFEELSPSDAPMSARSEEHPSPKRSKSLAAATSASMPSTPLRPNAPAWRTPSPGGTFAPPAGIVPSTQTTSSTGPTATQLHYPVHFMKGSIIQLANGDLKNVEELRTEDFVSSAELSGDLKIDSSTVVRIQENMETGTCMLSFSVGEQRVQVTVEAALEHPFFVFGQGWSSCLPDRTFQRYSLQCQKLQVGDVCISLTHRDVPRNSSNNNATTSTTTATTSTATLSTSVAVTAGTMALVPPHPVTFGPSSTATFLVSSSAAEGARNSAPAAPQTHSIETQTPASEASVVPTPITDSAAAALTPPSLATGAATTTTPATATGAPAAAPTITTTPRKRRWSAPDKISDEPPGTNAKLS